MTNEVNSINPISVAPVSLVVAESKSAVHSVSGKQVPPPGRAEPESRTDSVSPSQEELQRAVETLSEHTKNLGRELHFEVDADSGQTVVQVIDPETDEVIRQIPGEEAIERARSKDISAMNIIDDRV